MNPRRAARRGLWLRPTRYAELIAEQYPRPKRGSQALGLVRGKSHARSLPQSAKCDSPSGTAILPTGMSRDNLETARRAYSEPDPLTALTAIAAPDVEIDLTAVYPDQPVLRGIDEARRFRDASPWGASQRFEPERYFDVDDERVLVFVRTTATGQVSGTVVEARPAHELTMRDGQLLRLKVYLDRAEALEATGLRE
jgi:ketosteroid isomerase-like protein